MTGVTMWGLVGAMSVATHAAAELEIINIRVGQGDATLIQGPQNTDGGRVNVLFDAGDMPDRGGDGGIILRELLATRGVSVLDYLIVSHDDADHIGGVAFGGNHGASFILGPNGAPGAVGDDDGDGVDDWEGEEPYYLPDPDELGRDDDVLVHKFIDYGDDLMRNTQAIRKYRGIANAMGERISISDQATVDSFEIDLGQGARMICFAANGYVRNRTSRVLAVNTPNERSLSFLVNYRAFDYLISGDLIGRRYGGKDEDAKVERAVGEAIAAAGFDVDVLHVNHHGANNGSESSFLKSIGPKVAIVSAGNRNSHGHPHKSVLGRLVRAGVGLIVQTEWGSTSGTIPDDVRDRQAIYQGDVVIATDGNDYTISTNRTFSTDES